MMTAVQWLLNEIVKLEAKYGIPGEIYQLCEQAKKIEKQQIMQSLNDGKAMAIGNLENKTLEQYYNETFNNED